MRLLIYLNNNNTKAQKGTSMVRRYALLIGVITIAPLCGAAHAPGELQAVTGSLGAGFVPFSSQAKQALITHLKTTLDISELPIVNRLEARDDDYLKSFSGELMRRIIGGNDHKGVELLVNVTGDCVGRLSDKEAKESSYMSYAARTGRVSVAEMLHSFGASVDAVPNEKISPLENAVKNSHFEMVRWLIDKGAKVDDPERSSILMSVVPQTKNDALCDLLIEHGADIGRLKERAGQVLGRMCDFSVVSLYQLRLLFEAGLDPNSQDSQGYTPFFHAIQSNNLQAINLLLAYGADPEARALDGRSPLHYALPFARPETVYAILPLYDEMQHISHDGSTLIHDAANFGQNFLETVLVLDMNRPER